MKQEDTMPESGAANVNGDATAKSRPVVAGAHLTVDAAQTTNKKHRKHRDGDIPAEVKEHSKVVEEIAAAFPFAPKEMARLTKSNEVLVQAIRRLVAKNRESHADVRARLNTLFAGRIEGWINACTDEETKAFFRRVWRD